MRLIRAVWDNPRIRAEAAWVLAHKLVEFVVAFAALKLLTNLVSKSVFGEYNIALTGLLLAADLLAIPIAHTYERNYHTAEANGTGRAALAQTMRWLVIVTIGVTVLAAALSWPASVLFGLEPLTILAAGLIFLPNRWRSFWVGVLDVRRQRAACAIHNVGFFATQTIFTALAVYLISPRATTALLAYAAAAAIFGAIGLRGLLRDLRRRPTGEPADLRRMFMTFGAPLGLLLVCQWLQNFSERYVLTIQLDLDAVGLYVAAYQVCGIPFTLLHAVLSVLVLPIAYQRAKDISDASQVYAGDRVLLLGVGCYIVVGALMVVAYWFCGQHLLRLLTTADYIMPATTLVCVAAARYLICLGMLLQMFFKVHQRMAALLGFGIIGGLIVIPASWFAVKLYGVLGAALGVLISGAIYNALVIFAPGGCLYLIRTVRAARTRQSDLDQEATR